jgi:hypothetical protein
MGKTLPPFSQLIESERRRWPPFKRILPKADQATFDQLFDCAKLHVRASVMVSRPWAKVTERGTVASISRMFRSQKDLRRLAQEATKTAALLTNDLLGWLCTEEAQKASLFLW